MNHQGCTPVAEQRVAVTAKVYVLVGEGDLCRSVCRNGEVRHVSGMMAFRIGEAVFPALRIEVGAGGLEVGRIALGTLVDVDSVFTRRQILQVEMNLDTSTQRFLESGRSEEGESLLRRRPVSNRVERVSG